MRRIRWLLCAVAVASFLVTGYVRGETPPAPTSPPPTPTRTGETAIPFRTLATSDWPLVEDGRAVPVLPEPAYGEGPTTLEQKAVRAADLRPYLFTSLQEAQAARALVGVPGAAVLAQVDYSQDVALIVFVGLGSACCDYEFVVRVADAGDGSITLYTLETRHGMGTADIRMPYQIIAIARDDLPAGFSPQTSFRALRSLQRARDYESWGD